MGVQHFLCKIFDIFHNFLKSLAVYISHHHSPDFEQADERAVLKHFKWPERKADAMREAAFEYRDIKQLHTEISSYEDDGSMPCEAALRKISNLLDKYT